MTTTDVDPRLQGHLLLGARSAPGEAAAFWASAAASGQRLEPAYAGASAAQVEEACVLAAEAFKTFGRSAPEFRAQLLEAIAQAILDLGDGLIVRAMEETGLPRGRLEGERGRTIGQLRLFASVLRDGGYLDVRIDPAMPDRLPAPRPDLRLMNVPLGPVAVFGASNFPLAFSVAGGDTASALAAGCPVVVKGHPAHPGVSELVGRAVQSAVAASGVQEGVFSLIYDADYTAGSALVSDPRIKAVGFTGSRRGGVALMALAAKRPAPIPVYAEMSSINPVVLMPQALEKRAESIGQAFVGSLTLGAGQFCTNPGLILAVRGEGLDRFRDAVIQAVGATTTQTMLSPGIAQAYTAGIGRHAAHGDVATVAGCGDIQTAVFSVSGDVFIKDRALHEELFGPASLIVACDDLAQLSAVIDSLEGQLTAAVHADADDQPAVAELMPGLEAKVGRLLFNGFGTGVEVAHAMVHGGPYPATSDGRSTSVGSLAIARFLRPFCYQDTPAELLPLPLRDENPLNLARRLNGVVSAA